MRRRFIQLVGISVLALLMLTATGCGKKSTSTTTTTTTETTASTETSETTTSETTTSKTTTSASGLGDLAGNCGELANLGQTLAGALSGTGGSDISKIADTMKAFADQAPDDLKSAFETYADTFTKIGDALDGVDMSNPTSIDPAALAKLSDTAALTEAATKISTWAAENCHA